MPDTLEQVESQQKKFDDFNQQLSTQETRIKVGVNRISPPLPLLPVSGVT